MTRTVIFTSDIYTKIQAIFALSILTFEILSPVAVVHAASSFEIVKEISEGIVIGNEYIRPPEKSLVQLEGDVLVKSQNDWRKEQKAAVKVVATTYMTSSAYNSLPGQTDNSPYHTAIGSLTRDGVVASNYFPIGTKIRFPDIFGDKEFRVEDRMNKRYNKVVDVWMEDLTEARKYGRRYVKVDIIKYGLGRGVE